MKKKCKDIDITDWQTVRPWVKDCIMRHKSRYDFKSLLIRHGLTREQYRAALKTQKYDIFENAIDSISKEACEHIKKRSLDLPPVVMRKMMDTTTGKVRDIGKESAMQQVYDHIAVGSCEEIFRCRMVDQQMSSIKKRGQIKGMQTIRSYIQRDNKAIRYAEKHDLRYTSKCKYHVKLDIRLCYPSADINIFMNLFEHDCGNETIIWLWWTLLSSHHVNGYDGFMIGALPSQWAVQIMLSCIYRHAMNLKYKRRGKAYKKITHMIMFMDDMLLFGSNRKQLLSAVRDICKYTKSELGFEIKSTYQIHELENAPVDMMGFVIYRNGKTEMRGRNFIKSRRVVLRYYAKGRLVYPQAQRLNSYKGFYKHSDSRKISQELKLDNVFKYCSKIISEHEKEARDGKSVFRGRTWSGVIYAADGRNSGSMAQA